MYDSFRIWNQLRKYWEWIRSLEHRIARIEKALDLSARNGHGVESNYQLIAVQEALADAESQKKGTESAPKGAGGTPNGKRKTPPLREIANAIRDRREGPGNRKKAFHAIGGSLRRDR